MSDITYRDATEADAPALAALFAETFCETFGHLYQPDDLTAFLAQHTAESWLHQLRDNEFAVRLAENDDATVGFAKLGPVKLPVDISRPALEIRQLYVAPEARGAGVAPSLMDWLLDEARRRGAEDAFLSVYTDNNRAKRFYARYGFAEVGPCTFMVGNQADADVIMKQRLV